MDSDAREMDVEMRRRILHTVNRYPGLHLREIQRRVDASVHLVEYHLNVLEQLQLILSAEEGGYRRLFPARGERAVLGAKERAWIGFLRQNLPLGITLHLLERSRLTHGEIAMAVPVTKSTLTYHLRNMREAGLLVRDPDKSFRLAEPERVLAILRAYKPTPDLIAAWGQMWTDIMGASGHDDEQEE